jgi:OOP family OmpA-OmpF porin
MEYLMKRLFFASLLSAAVLVVTGCTAGSGPTFNAYSVDRSDGARIYRAECHGLFEGASTCMDVARRICGDKPVHPIDKIDVVRAADDQRSDPRVLHFECGEALSNKAAAETGAVAAQATTLENFSLESDALFPFGKSSPESMLPAAKARLDEIAERIRQHEQVSAITVVGHTDRLGPESINGPLSLARANTVRDYLVAHGLDGSIIHAKGVGSSEPRTHCPEGDARALIACLQQDRYVSITAEGRK